MSSVKDEGVQDATSSKQDPSSGPIRNKASTDKPMDSSTPVSSSHAEQSKAPFAAPVKSACTFCRSRKSRCDGKQPCAACVNRGRTDDCVYTISRRGGKPKSKNEKLEPLEVHLEKLLGLSELPHLVRIPNAVPQLQGFQEHQAQQGFNPFQGIDPSLMGNPSTSQPLQSIVSSPIAALTPDSSALSFPSQSIADPPSSQSLLSDYYRLLYRFAAVLPHPHHIEVIASALPSSSPLFLALQCIVPVIKERNTEQSGDEEKKARIRHASLHYAKKAYSAIDEVLENVENQQGKGDYSILEVIQALCILVIYEYGSGRALKSRLKVDAALTLAMSKGLHRLSSRDAINGEDSIAGYSSGHYLSLIPTEELYEVKKRLWWTLWTFAMWTAYNTGRIPTVRADDSRVTSELPSSTHDNYVWTHVITSLQGLLTVQDRVLALAHIEHGRSAGDGQIAGTGSPGMIGANESPSSFSSQPSLASKEDILRSMLELDSSLQDQMRILEQTTQGIITPNITASASSSYNDDLEKYLQYVWATQVYTTSLTLHIGQAFQGATLFERKLCFLGTISEANDAATCQVPMPNAFDGKDFANPSPLTMAPDQDLYARGPFAPRESLKRCVDASDKLLLISRNLRHLEAAMASPNPFNACSFVLISFVCLMQALAISSNSPEDTANGQPWSVSRQTDASLSVLTTDTTPSLLRSAQSAAALTSIADQSHGGSSSSDTDAAFNSRQEQLQMIWARVKEAKDALYDLSRYWDMVIPMCEEVAGCLEASQFLLSQQNTSSEYTI